MEAAEIVRLRQKATELQNQKRIEELRAINQEKADLYWKQKLADEEKVRREKNANK